MRLRTVAAVAIVVTLAGCSSPAVTSTVVMTEFAYEPSTIRLPADADGFVLRLINDGDLPHDFSIEGLPSATPVHLALFPEAEADYPLPALPRGSYTVYCGVEGHREQGMETTLEVT